MISKFATVYPGHVDMPDRGQDATPANERRFSNDELAGVFAKTEAIARLMDETGWDTLWLAEHHFQFEALTSRRCGIRCGSPRTMPALTS
jgi:alkanesulfonate monooxygenase SsuD/methylene tetrahydromethanopterin reductase-like flavin-dependent oxidoreductase (luciferase family)